MHPRWISLAEGALTAANIISSQLLNYRINQGCENARSRLRLLILRCQGQSCPVHDQLASKVHGPVQEQPLSPPRVKAKTGMETPICSSAFSLAASRTAREAQDQTRSQLSARASAWIEVTPVVWTAKIGTMAQLQCMSHHPLFGEESCNEEWSSP